MQQPFPPQASDLLNRLPLVFMSQATLHDDVNSDGTKSKKECVDKINCEGKEGEDTPRVTKEKNGSKESKKDSQNDKSDEAKKDDQKKAKKLRTVSEKLKAVARTLIAHVQAAISFISRYLGVAALMALVVAWAVNGFGIFALFDIMKVMFRC